MKTESPFKFLDSYSKEDKDIFFGRDQEIDEVYNKVFQDKTLFVYGESGTGKSSLINCGLANKFKDTDWLPVNVRRGDNINDSLINELKKLSLTEVTNLNGSFQKNLFRYTRSLYLDYFKPIYFIFDQFEELYLMGSKSEWKEFITGIKLLAERDLQVHFIFIIRAEYLHFMSEFEEELPDIFNNKLRIEKITRLKAKECIEGPCKVFGIKVDAEFPDQLFDQLSPGRNDIELTYLQVFLDRIYKMAREEAREIDNIVFSKELLDKIGMVSDVLSDFLDEQIDSLPDKETNLIILKAFVTADGTKRQVSIDEIVSFGKSLGKDLSHEKVEQLGRELLERRILKELPDLNKYELRHDALAQKIFEKITAREKELIEIRQFLDYGLVEYKKRGYVLNDRDMAYVQPHLEVLNLDGDLKQFVDASLKSVRKKQRTRKQVIVVISIIIVLCITSIYGFITASQQRTSAEEQKSLAVQNAKEARVQKDNAEQSAQLARIAQREAETNAEEASLQASIAARQQVIADQQRTVAETQRKEALIQRQNAIVAQQLAESNAQEAVTQKNIADEERKNAERLRMLSLAQSLGAKSIQSRDSQVKSFMAAQAYQFNTQFDGDPLENAVFGGLFYSSKFLNGDGENSFTGQIQDVKSLGLFKNQVVSVGSDGKVIIHSMTTPDNLVIDLNVRNALNAFPEFVDAINSALIFDKYVIAGSEEGRLILLDLEQEKVINQAQAFDQNDGFWKINLDATGSLFSISILGNIHQWDIKSYIEGKPLTGDLLYEPEPLSKLNALEIDGDDNILFNKAGNLHKLQVGDRVLQTISMPTIESSSDISRITLDDSGKSLAVGFNDGSIQLYNYQNNALIASLPGHASKVADIAFNQEGTLMASGSLDKTLKIWNLNNITKLPTVIDDFDSWVIAIIFSNDGKKIITGESNGNIRVISINPEDYYTQLCAFVDRNMTKEEWSQIVGEEFAYSETCPITNKNK